MEQIKLAAWITLILAAVVLAGCNAYPRTMVGFWDQKVSFTAWGITFASEAGPLNVGYIQWNRNVEPLKPANPSDVIIKGY